MGIFIIYKSWFSIKLESKKWKREGEKNKKEIRKIRKRSME
jgi:hypothetical protein